MLYAHDSRARTCARTHVNTQFENKTTDACTHELTHTHTHVYYVRMRGFKVPRTRQSLCLAIFQAYIYTHMWCVLPTPPPPSILSQTVIFPGSFFFVSYFCENIGGLTQAWSRAEIVKIGTASSVYIGTQPDRECVRVCVCVRCLRRCVCAWRTNSHASLHFQRYATDLRASWDSGRRAKDVGVFVYDYVR